MLDARLRQPTSAAAPSVLAGSAIRSEVVRRVVTRVLGSRDAGAQRLEEVLFETVYQEERRLAHGRASARAEADAAFLRELRRGLARAHEARSRELLHRAVRRYAEEISGFFSARVYRFATRALPPALGALMHGGRPTPELFRVEDRILIEGEIAAFRAATRRGTVVLVPTHVSNLDSLLLGYAIFALGVAPFAYAAGLNLFTNPLTGYFMRNLGAFTIDRQKTDPLYKAALKEYMTVLLERGQHTLLFPGGTRSRAGAIESRLKLGLIGTAITAFANLQRAAPARPIFIVPCTLSYPLVLEASSLIAEYLRSEGGSHYLELHDEFDHPARWYEFLRGLSQLDVQVHVRLGQPLDVLGHPADMEGTSRWPAERVLEPSDYFRVNGSPRADAARDAEYTRVLAERLLESYRRLSVALPSSALAFVLFERLRLRFPQLDMFRLLRALGDQASVSLEDARTELTTALRALSALADRGALALAPELRTGSADRIMERAVAALSSYHSVPALRLQDGRLHVQDPALLFYYRNRLDGYGLLGAPALAALFARKSAGRTA